jgi:hypothetical protein
MIDAKDAHSTKLHVVSRLHCVSTPAAVMEKQHPLSVSPSLSGWDEENVVAVVACRLQKLASFGAGVQVKSPRPFNFTSHTWMGGHVRAGLPTQSDRRQYISQPIPSRSVSIDALTSCGDTKECLPLARFAQSNRCPS